MQVVDSTVDLILIACTQLPCFMQDEDMQPGGRHNFASQQQLMDEDDEDGFDQTSL